MPKPTPSSRVIRIGAFELHTSTGELTRDGGKAQLTVQLLQVLLALLENPGELVTREELVRRLWPSDTFVDFDHSLNKAVNKLRDALGDSADKPTYIETLPRRGYRLIAPVEKESIEPELEEPAATATVKISPQETKPETFAVVTPRHRYLAITLGIVGAGLLLLAIPAFRNAVFGRASAHTLTDRDTILVADFVNKTGDSVFDDALKEGLLADLSQSPFLNILSDSSVRQQLRFMERPVETPLTPDVAREVCQRANSKAMLLGSITGLGTHYAITLKAVACDDGNALHVEQQEADRREHVLAKLHEAARSVRGKLGESLASIQKHDTPLFEGTASLEALEAYGVAMRTWRSKGDAAALPLFQRVIAIDPNFAVANVGLGIVHANLGQAALSAEFIAKAYHLRDRVSERERFSIDSAYFLNVTGEQEKAIQVNEQWRQIYPRDLAPRVNIGAGYANLGWIEKAWAEDLEAVKLAPNTSLLISNLFSDYVNLDRLQEAKTILEQARTRKLSDPLLINYYQLAFLQNDEKEMERCVSAAVDAGSEDLLLASQADTEAFHGRLRRASDFSGRALAAALRANDKEAAAGWLVSEALRESELGNRGPAAKKAELALTLTSARDKQLAAALAIARAGDVGRAQALLEALHKNYPTNTLLTEYWLPTIRAAVAIDRHDGASAIAHLQSVTPYELGGGKPPFTAGATMYPVYLRGQAYLTLHKWNEATVEFQKILSHRGIVWNSPLAALAHLQIGRAYAGAGDSANARSSFGRFLSLWSDADSDHPTLRSAKAELAALQ
ncbi:MAG: winged helix-turn-helix domain-containing protein [Acidobacteria bacterium]|nr:winged helix-turn-helix domain-containing protein [Acidobacteriota bacterium]